MEKWILLQEWFETFLWTLGHHWNAFSWWTASYKLFRGTSGWHEWICDTKKKMERCSTIVTSQQEGPGWVQTCSFHWVLPQKLEHPMSHNISRSGEEETQLFMCVNVCVCSCTVTKPRKVDQEVKLTWKRRPFNCLLHTNVLNLISRLFALPSARRHLMIKDITVNHTH